MSAARGDYQPLPITGAHRDHVIAFARRRGRDAAIVAVAKSFAAFTQGGRAWPRAENFDGALDLSGYAVEGIDSNAGANELRFLGAVKTAGRGAEGDRQTGARERVRTPKCERLLAIDGWRLGGCRADLKKFGSLPRACVRWGAGTSLPARSCMVPALRKPLRELPRSILSAQHYNSISIVSVSLANK